MTAHEDAIELLARCVWVLARVESAVPDDLTGGARREFVADTKGWLLGSVGAPGRWGTCGHYDNETATVTLRLANARRYIDEARAQLEAHPKIKGYPPHLLRTIQLDVTALQGDLADVCAAIGVAA